MADLPPTLTNHVPLARGRVASAAPATQPRGDGAPVLDPREVMFIREAVLAFFEREKRALPWRDNLDPYRILVSEVMLQQTRVDTVLPYFERWMERFPDLDRLAAADEEEVLRAWQGLGYYSRARNLHRTVREVAHRFDGRIPEDPAVLRKLPGIGPYTAGAVASIAFGVPVAAVDGNTRRVLARLMDAPKPSAARLLKWATAMVDPQDPGDFNQALMELGAQVCVPARPRCGDCPLQSVCRANRAGTQGTVPVPRTRRRVPHLVEALVGLVSSVEGEPRVLLRRRPPEGLLGGLWELPGSEVSECQSPVEAAMDIAVRLTNAALSTRVGESGRKPPSSSVRLGPDLTRQLDPVDHSFTHRRVRYIPFVFSVRRPTKVPERDSFRWVTRSQAQKLPIGAAQLRVLKKIF